MIFSKEFNFSFVIFTTKFAFVRLFIKLKAHLEAVAFPALTTTSLDSVNLIDVMSALVCAIGLLRLDPRVLQFIAVLDARAQLPVLLHH